MVWVLNRSLLTSTDKFLIGNFFYFLFFYFFWSWNIKVWCSTRLYSWIAPFCIICKRSSPIIIRSWLLFVCGWDLYFLSSYQYENIKKIEDVLNKEFLSLCQSFINNKLSIHFGGNKTKCILFSKARDLREIIRFISGHSINQHETTKYLSFQWWIQKS